MVAWLGPPVLSVWLLRGWLERRGLSAELAVMVAVALGAVPGVLVGWLTGWTRPSGDPEERRRVAVAAAASRRKRRRWTIVSLVLLLVYQVGGLSLAFFHAENRSNDWGFLLVLVPSFMNTMPDVLPSRTGRPSGVADPDEAGGREALRVGYLVLLVLGLVAAGAGTRWPLLAGQAWPAVLVASLLASQVRLATLARSVDGVA